MNQPCGLIAGNGRFPFLVLEAAHSMGIPMVVAAIQEETDPKIAETGAEVHWLSLGQLGKLIKLFRQKNISQAVMAGQVKHKQIFSSIVPDLHLVRLLAGLARKNTDSLIGAVANYLAGQGITLIDSTVFIQPLLAEPGTMTGRMVTEEENGDILFGLPIAREIARMDIGQTILVRDRAVVAVEAMEGTDETIRRAGRLCSRQGLIVIKVSKPNQDMRFDVPVIGRETLRIMKESGAVVLSVDAGKTLLFDKKELLEMADQYQISIVGQEVPA
jgi:UDP-2,3-diacylglucosamine hydrolase